MAEEQEEPERERERESDAQKKNCVKFFCLALCTKFAFSQKTESEIGRERESARGREKRPRRDNTSPPPPTCCCLPPLAPQWHKESCPKKCLKKLEKYLQRRKGVLQICTLFIIARCFLFVFCYFYATQRIAKLSGTTKFCLELLRIFCRIFLQFFRQFLNSIPAYFIVFFMCIFRKFFVDVFQFFSELFRFFFDFF